MASQGYVAGFLFDPVGQVALVRKKRPDWQAGLLNGVGGHIEPGEFPWQAMVREFTEETGYHTEDWRPFARLTGKDLDWSVWFFRAEVDRPLQDVVETLTDEEIEIRSASGLLCRGNRDMIPNLQFLIPLAIHATGYHVIEIREK